MEDTPQNRELTEELQKIKEKLQELSKKYTDRFEYSFIFTKYKDVDGQYDFGSHMYKIVNESNLDIYKDSLTAIKYSMLEARRFEEVKNLPEFQVVCHNDDMNQDIRDCLIQNGGDWIRREETYVVVKRQKSISGGWTFTLRKDGEILRPPYPFEGYHSSRFKVKDYSRLN